MKRVFKSASSRIFDIIVIGGGIIGSGIARDAALRGLDTLLLEKEDFGCGTTSRSTRLVHGGLRYLGHLDFGLVRQDLSEREILLRIAPHLVKPLKFLIPVHSSFLNITMALGVTLYDIISYDKSLPSHRYLTKKHTLEQEPDLKINNLLGSYVYYDCQIAYAERLNFENALSANINGATVINHANVINIIKNGTRVIGVDIRDELTGDITHATGKIVVNATGHWVDSLKSMVFPNKPPYLHRTKGVHLVIPKVSNEALVLLSPIDSRLFFIIPWEGYSLVGTTDTDYSGDLNSIYATRSDVDYLLDGLHLAYPDITLDDILYTMAGLRSLVLKNGKKASDISRSHQIIDHSKHDNLDGMITVLGGKITAYRSVAKETVDAICHKLKIEARCTTAEIPLPGSPAVDLKEAKNTASSSGLPLHIVNHLASVYGQRYKEVVEMARQIPEALNPIDKHQPDILGEIWYAVKQESACTLSDFMFRRSIIGLRADRGKDVCDTIASEMQIILGWSEATKQNQLKDYQAQLLLGQHFRYQK